MNYLKPVIPKIHLKLETALTAQKTHLASVTNEINAVEGNSHSVS